MTGALNFANSTRNSIGDDCVFGDYNEGGCVGFQGLNGNTGISLIQKGASWDNSASRYKMTWNGSNMTSSSTALWTNLNADLLDGLHQTSFLRTNGDSQYVTLTGGSGNTAGWRLVLQTSAMGGWVINSMTLLVNSRHQGTGIISIVFHTTNEAGTTYTGEVRYYGSTPSMDTTSWRAFYNTSTKIFRLFWRYYDYSNCNVSILNKGGLLNNISNGTWYTSLPSDIGTELPTYYNVTSGAQSLYTARTINGTSFNGTANITTSYWGTARTINGTSINGSTNYVTSYWGTTRAFYVRDHNSGHTGAVTNVNGSTTYYLYLPSTINAALSGNATTATTLQTARTINGTSFNGSANITTSYWGTARTFYTNSYDSYKVSSGVSVNGSGNVTLLLPTSIRCSEWFRSIGNTGWYSETYGGGIYMIDSNYIRNYNSKRLRIQTDTYDTIQLVRTSSTGGSSVAFYNSGGTFKGQFGCTANSWFSFDCGTATANQNVVEISPTGTLNAKGDVTAKASGSDIRLKKDIQDYDAMTIIRRFRSVKYHWNDIAKANAEIYNNDYDQYGLIAQDLLNGGFKQWVKDAFKDYYIISYERLIPVLWKGVQEVDNEVASLRRRVEYLENEIKRLCA